MKNTQMEQVKATPTVVTKCGLVINHGDIIDIQQTVNGVSEFLIEFDGDLNVQAKYYLPEHSNIHMHAYQYSISELLNLNEFDEETDCGIIKLGNNEDKKREMEKAILGEIMNEVTADELVNMTDEDFADFNDNFTSEEMAASYEAWFWHCELTGDPETPIIVTVEDC